MKTSDYGLELKFSQAGEAVQVTDGTVIEGYASLYGVPDQGGDVVQPGAYARSLERLRARGGSVKMLWQHDPAQPIGVWDEIREDARGLYVKGRLLLDVERAREAAALIGAGAIDGLSIGYRTVSAQKDAKGQRLLAELELWEVSLVTFPMLREARVAAKGDSPDPETWREMVEALNGAAAELARR
ncbi:HK97 family phage prohead protease [Sedimentimonas flavescens]|uniref:HK97 family phage prohead protease n=1 Tax=Sedimentimonas flavescens TaxID=2851012 RepID=UPI001C4A5E39|nr:HK97 family phage prohead protease [Sedimentimonas flavescens]MBW0157278.1 HK97 family phage prohead protease [Sedimentimonas flavescens]MCT2538550.1 HK97 family phage prohead protease [Sedimentimonas flavescens]WBL34417.1 HK97 family phage prohead protease [Sinirhodobacter sp. HNIBRBA609]